SYGKMLVSFFGPKPLEHLGDLELRIHQYTYQKPVYAAGFAGDSPEALEYRRAGIGFISWQNPKTHRSEINHYGLGLYYKPKPQPRNHEIGPILAPPHPLTLSHFPKPRIHCEGAVRDGDDLVVAEKDGVGGGEAEVGVEGEGAD